MVKEFLAVEHIDVPVEFRVNARRFLYYQLFRSTLPFGEFLEEDGVWPGFVQLRNFPWQKLSPEESPTVRVIVQGITNGDPFTMPDESAF